MATNINKNKKIDIKLVIQNKDKCAKPKNSINKYHKMLGAGWNNK